MLVVHYYSTYSTNGLYIQLTVINGVLGTVVADGAPTGNGDCDQSGRIDPLRLCR